MLEGNNNVHILVTWTLMSEMKGNFRALFTLLKTYHIGESFGNISSCLRTILLYKLSEGHPGTGPVKVIANRLA